MEIESCKSWVRAKKIDRGVLNLIRYKKIRRRINVEDIERLHFKVWWILESNKKE